MGHLKRSVSALIGFSLYIMVVSGQSAISSSGSSISSTGGSISCTAGQIVYMTFSGEGVYVSQGVQQPYEISLVTSIKTTEDISIECYLYPNPTGGVVTMIMRPLSKYDSRYRIYNVNGILIVDKKIESETTVISLEKYPPSLYFLKVFMNNMDIKVFKIVKN